MSAASAGSARSPPGHGTPRPSPLQNTPKADSNIPTASFRVFSGTRTSGRCTAKPIATTSAQAASAPRLAARRSPCPVPTASTMNTTSRPSRSTPLKHASGDPVHAHQRPVSQAAAELRRRALEDPLLIAQRDDACSAEDCLVQPPRAKQEQQNADDELECRQRYALEDWTEREHHERKGRESGERPGSRRAPAAHGAYGQHDGDGLDRLDEGRQKRRRNGRRRRSPAHETGICAGVQPPPRARMSCTLARSSRVSRSSAVSSLCSVTVCDVTTSR